MVVVGASLAGLRACETLRTAGYTGEITLIGAEEHLPYDRPPLSKKLLAGDWEPDRIALRKPDDVDALGLQLRLGISATALDVDDRARHLADGTAVPYDGRRPRHRLPARAGCPARSRSPTVHELRTLDDSLRLRPEIADGTARVVVIGAGFIGLEVAATARGRGCAVTVLEAAPAPLIRGLGAEMGAAVAGVHAADGIEVRSGVLVEQLEAGGVRLVGGEHLPADVIVVGVGVAPATEWLEGSGLELRDGVVCDAALRAGPPASTPPAICPGGRTSCSTRRCASSTGRTPPSRAPSPPATCSPTAAGDRPEPYAPVPFFWSDQGRQRVQFLGRGGTRGTGRRRRGRRRPSRRAPVPRPVRPPRTAARRPRAQRAAPRDALPRPAGQRRQLGRCAGVGRPATNLSRVDASYACHPRRDTCDSIAFNS